MTARLVSALCLTLSLPVVVDAQDHAPAAKAPETARAHGIVRKAPVKTAGAGSSGVITTAPPAGAARSPEADAITVAPAASTEAVAAAIAAAVKAVEEKKAAEGKKASDASRRAIDRPRVRAVPRRRYTVQWPSQRLEVRWTDVDDRVRLSWNEPAPAPDVHRSLEP